VPRWPWIEVEFQELIQDELVEKKERFEWFAARVMQHEIDHLDGILFTDYSLEYDLPVYQEDPETEKMHRVKPAILETF
jgi:peptide deformylase